MDDFNFYLKFAKPLVLNLPDAKDRTIAALWVKKLRDMQSEGPEADMRIEYLKLLLFVMQRNKLTGIFEKAPSDDPLQGFPQNYKVPRSIIVEDDNLKITIATDMLSLVRPEKAPAPVYPAVFTSVGGDLCQFVAVQEIPNFGLHGYYAISTEPLSKWSQASTITAKKAAMKPTHFANCFQNSCKLTETTICPKKSSVDSTITLSPEGDQEPRPGTSGQNIRGSANPKTTDTAVNTRERKECEKQQKPTIQFSPLPPIPIQSYRTEIAGFESRPSWGRRRYIERLIDESPHLTADIDVSQADALLHVMNDKIFKKGDNYGPCAISETRRRVERMMDRPPCAVDTERMKPYAGPSYTCCSKKERNFQMHPDVCLSDQDFHPCGKKSDSTLRGGSDSGSCCNIASGRTRSGTSSYNRANDMNSYQYYTTESLRDPQRRIQAGGNDSIFEDIDAPLDVDTSIHDAEVINRHLDSDISGNFKWLEDMEHINVSNPELFTESGYKGQKRQFPSNATANDGSSEFDEESLLNEELHTEKLMPQVSRRMSMPKQYQWRKSPSSSKQSASYNQDTWKHQRGRRSCDAQPPEEDSCEEADMQPSMAVVRRRYAKSREATNNKPAVYESTYRWKEIVDEAPASRDQTLRLKDGQRMSRLDPEYLDYIKAVERDRKCCSDDDDGDDEEIEEPRYSSHRPMQILDKETAEYTHKLLRPPKLPSSPGRVTMPLSKQSYRRQKSEKKHYKQPPAETSTDADEQT